MSCPDLDNDHRALLERIETTTRWLKRTLNHSSSKNTEDFREIACEKLLRSEKYGPTFRQQPRQLMPMVSKMMQRILIDDARRSRAARRPPRSMAVDIADNPVAVTAEAEHALVNRRRLARLEAALERFERGESPGRVRTRNRLPMVRAVRMRRQGWTHQRIASELAVSPATVNAWLQLMTAHLAVQLAREEP